MGFSGRASRDAGLESAGCPDARRVCGRIADILEELAAAGPAPAEAVSALAAAARAAEAMCTPAWRRAGDGERAEALGPLASALLHLEEYLSSRDSYHAEAAETLALIALARLGEVRRRRHGSTPPLTRQGTETGPGAGDGGPATKETQS